MAIIIKWSTKARNSRKSIFEYWNKRNKSRTYSNKLDILFNEALNQVSFLNEIGKPTDIPNVRIKVVSHFELIYIISATQITVLDIWDSRQNPKNSPIE